MRSWLFVPGDDEHKMRKALKSDADHVILDLEDSVALAAKETARSRVAGLLSAPRSNGPALFVRINGLDDTGLAQADLDTIMGAGPDGIMLPKAANGAAVGQLDAMITAREARHALTEGSTEIAVIATELPAAMFGLGSYPGASARLKYMTWGSEDLSAAVGALTDQDSDGNLTHPYQLVRSLCLFAAAACGCAAIDAITGDFTNDDRLMRECHDATRDGFVGKLAIHPRQVPIINAAFTPTSAQIQQAQAIIAAFADSDAGVVNFSGRMLDLPHLKRAQNIVARAADNL